MITAAYGCLHSVHDEQKNKGCYFQIQHSRVIIKYCSSWRVITAEETESQEEIGD
jgi:hypothetical protein